MVVLVDYEVCQNSRLITMLYDAYLCIGAWIEIWSSSTDSASSSGLGYWLGVYGTLSFVEATSMVLAV